MLIKGIPGVKTRDQLREHIARSGCYSPEENLRIYDKWFATAPRYLFHAINKKYGISEKILCDMGCAYGMNLVFSPIGSYGIEIEEYERNFAHHIGLTVYQRDIIADDFCDLPKVEVVWSSGVLEYLESPHIALRKMHLLLKPGGLLVLYTSMIPWIPWLSHLRGLERYVSGFKAGGVINSFVPSTLRFFCERAGFKTLEISSIYPGIVRIFNRVPIMNRLTSVCVYIGQKIDHWEYPENSPRRVALNRAGFVYLGQQFPKVVESN